METTYRRFSIGIQNFEQLRNNNCVYIDKTELIYKLTHSNSVYLLSRPQRFGKSLLVSTLEAYFQGKKHLFEGLAMERLETEWAEYPVLYMDFSVSKYTEADKLREVLNIQISRWEKIYGKDANECSFSNRFEGVIQRAYQKTGKQDRETLSNHLLSAFPLDGSICRCRSEERYRTCGCGVEIDGCHLCVRVQV